jgi:hypothetical protein
MNHLANHYALAPVQSYKFICGSQTKSTRFRTAATFSTFAPRHSLAKMSESETSKPLRYVDVCALDNPIGT